MAYGYSRLALEPQHSGDFVASGDVSVASQLGPEQHCPQHGIVQPQGEG